MKSDVTKTFKTQILLWVYYVKNNRVRLGMFNTSLIRRLVCVCLKVLVGIIP